MYRKTFVCICRRTISLMHAIFNTVHAMSDMDNLYKFQDILRMFMWVRAWKDSRTKCIPKHFSTLSTFIILISYCYFYSENSSNVLERETVFWGSIKSLPCPHLIVWKIWDFTHLTFPLFFQSQAVTGTLSLKETEMRMCIIYVKSLRLT